MMRQRGKQTNRQTDGLEKSLKNGVGNKVKNLWIQIRIEIIPKPYLTVSCAIPKISQIKHHQ